MINTKIDLITEFVKNHLKNDLSHTFEHIKRVYQLAINIAKTIHGVDLYVIKVSSLLHDIARYYEDIDDLGKTDHSILGAKISEKFLKKLNFNPEFIKKVNHCIITHRFRSKNIPNSIEAKILFDADKLDLLGSIGIIRIYGTCFKYGQKIYSDIPIDEYIKKNQINGKINGIIKKMSEHAPNIEFELKIKEIPRKLHFDISKRIANERIKIMKLFFNELKSELEQKDDILICKYHDNRCLNKICDGFRRNCFLANEHEKKEIYIIEKLRKMNDMIK